MQLTVTTTVSFVQARLTGASGTFQLPSTPIANSLSLYINGLFLTAAVDYVLSGSSVTLLSKTVTDSDVLSAHYLAVQ